MSAVGMFRDPESAERARARLETATGLPLRADFEALFSELPEPDRALLNLERWLQALGNSSTYLQTLLEHPALARGVLVVLGSGQAPADALIQNPELGAALLDSPPPLEPEVVRAEGRGLLRNTSSYSHRLDRLRYLRQRWNLVIVLSDLLGRWEPETVWRAISDLADAILELTVEVVWAEVAKDDSACPLLVVAFGKLAGHELNYSSDVDLVYVAPDGDEDPRWTRFAEMFSRALADRMGRGMLYRVDVRLRPYGSRGALTPTMRAVEAYYERYAEPWEFQALLRSRPVSGPADLAERWEAMRAMQCFRPQVSEFFLDELVANRQRVEEFGDEEDLKRGRGGIRDIEFFVQIRQLVEGARKAAARVTGTLPALRALRLDPTGELEAAYTFFRQLEHRIQLVDDQQTHRLPQSPQARDQVARLMNLANATQLEADLAWRRMRVRQTYQEQMLRETAPQGIREAVAERVGTHAGRLVNWIDRMPEAEAFYRVLAENEGSLGRVQRVLTEAPLLLGWVQDDLALTEAILSGEIEEVNTRDPFEILPQDASPAQIAHVIRAQTVGSAFRWVTEKQNLGGELARLHSQLLGWLARRFYFDFDLIALGSFANEELGLESDLDLLLLVEDENQVMEAETQARQLLALIESLRRHGAPIQVDLRLRPEGGKGLLVRSYRGFKAYDLEDMEMWERFALGSARLVAGREASIRLVAQVANGMPLTPERLQELVQMKRRIETERVAPQHLLRNVKLGHGGLGDIEWLVRLHELRFPTATQAGQHRGLPARLRRLAEARLIHALELETLLTGHRHLVEVRHWLSLLQLRHDTVPENPDKLDQLAQQMGHPEGNDFLRAHERHREAVRGLYLEALERLRA